MENSEQSNSIVKMLRAVTVLCAIAVFVVIFEQVSCHGWGHHRRHGHHHHHRGHHHHRALYVNVVIYDPKGMELYTQKLNNTAQYFGFDIFINNPNGSTPDVSHNTTEVTYGKYIVRDTEVIIKPGDVINITSYMGFMDGGVLRSTTVFPVSRYMIKNNCTCENATSSKNSWRTPIKSIPPWSRTTTRTTTRSFSTRRTTTPPTTVPTTPDWEMEQSLNAFNNDRFLSTTEQYTDYSDEMLDCEIDPTTNLCSGSILLDTRSGAMSRKQSEKLVKPGSEVDISVFRDIFNAIIDDCGTHTRTNLLAMHRPVFPVDKSTDWIGHVRKMLKKSLNLHELADKSLINAQPHAAMVIFEMDTLFHKMVVLYQAQKFGVMSVQDYDDLK
uniref:CBM39 domain-containing protein n=1 Tax=Anopheles minimus TaxID=112268 RepID=A0A182WGZ7_9DIPT